MNFKYLRENPEVIQENMSLVYDQLTWQLFGEGGRWYPLAHSYAQDFADDYKKSLMQAAGIISVLSPQKSWEHNLLLVEQFLKSKGKKCGHLGQQVAKAKEIYRYKGESPEELAGIVRGDKTTNFFFNILDPYDDRWVTIDSHMSQLMTGNLDVKVVPTSQYNFLKEQLILFANKEKVSPPTLQAALWLTFKRIKPRRLEKTNILYNLVV